VSALDDLIAAYRYAYGAEPQEADAARAELAALRRERDEMRRLVAGCAPYIHKAEHVIGCQARYGEKTCACGLFGLRVRIDAALRGEGKA